MEAALGTVRPGFESLLYCLNCVILSKSFYLSDSVFLSAKWGINTIHTLQVSYVCELQHIIHSTCYSPVTERRTYKHGLWSQSLRLSLQCAPLAFLHPVQPRPTLHEGFPDQLDSQGAPASHEVLRTEARPVTLCDARAGGRINLQPHLSRD